MKKLLTLTLIAFSLHGTENTNVLEKAIISSDLQKVTTLISALKLSKTEKKRLLKLSDEIIIKRQNTLNQNPLFSCVSGFDALLVAFQAFNLQCMYATYLDIISNGYGVEKGMDSCERKIDRINQLLIKYPSSRNDWENHLKTWNEFLEQSIDLKKENFSLKKMQAVFIGCGFIAVMVTSYVMINNAKKTHKELDADLKNALLIYQILYQIEVAEAEIP
jgi:hypothetical protein